MEQYTSSLGKVIDVFSRDLRLLLKPANTFNQARHPALLPRPSSSCFIFDMEHIKLLCFKDKCLILNPDPESTHSFIKGLEAQFKFADNYENGDSAMRLLHQKSVQFQDFEHVILENALEYVVQKFRRHLHIIKPALEILLEQIESNPETNGLKRLLAVKKSLAEFEQNVDLVRKTVWNILSDDEAIVNLYLTNTDIQVGEQEEVELLLTSIVSDIDEILTEIKILIVMIEDTDQFISAHLDSVRNEIIKMSLFIEVGALVMGVGAVVSGVFGMNLTNSLEENPYAFIIVCGGIMFTMLALFAGFTTKYFQLKADTTSAQSFTLLKNFFTYVDDLDDNLFNKGLDKPEFKETAEKITGLKITQRESDYIYKMVDSNTNANVENEIKLNFLTENYLQERSETACETSLSYPIPSKQ